MDKKSILGFVLIAVILVVWMTINSNNTAKEAALQKKKDDSITRVDSIQRLTDVATAKRKADSIALLPKDTAKLAGADSVVIVPKEKVYRSFEVALSGDNTPVIIENEKLKATIFPLGGRIGQVELKGLKTSAGKPLILFGPDSTHFGLTFFDKDDRQFNTDSLYFSIEGKSFSVGGNDSNSIAVRLYEDTTKAKYIEYVYTLKGNSYILGCTMNFIGFDKIFSPNRTDAYLKWAMNVPQQEKAIKNEQTISTVYYNFVGEEGVEYLSVSENEKKSDPGEVKWVSFKQQYFSSVLIAENKFSTGTEVEVKMPSPSDPFTVKSMSTVVPISLGKSAKESFPLKFYFGPNKFSELKSYDIHLERQIDLGWGLFGWLNRFIFIPLFSFLGSNIVSYGLVILVLTIIVKIVMFPIAYKSFLSSAKMRVLKPEIEEINEKFGKDDPLKKQQATMALYKKAGVNPAAGCIPLLLQIPILFSLIRLFPAAFELRQQPFLWATDLSTYDSIWDFGFSIPAYGDHMSLFALLMTISTLLYTWMNQQMLSPGSAQMPGMKWLIYLMPVFFLVFLNSYSAALSYYYFLSNVISFGQMWFMQRYVDHDAIRAKIDENKKKPVKQSGFMQRLEQAQKKRLEQVKEQQGKGGNNNKGKKK
ncbi:MAG: membrane protein insertase YidC [Bacteroidota bacterium]|nr:membrane protein insertase YidC [Bacteroidota bacterium]